MKTLLANGSRILASTDSQQLRALIRQAIKDAKPESWLKRCAMAAPTAIFFNSFVSSCPQTVAHRMKAKRDEQRDEPSADAVKIGIVSVSDRASSGVYVHQGLPCTIWRLVP